MSEEQVLNLDTAAKENVLMVAAVGVAAMLAGAILWALVTVITQSELGLMAIAVGFIVGIAIQKVRRRPSKNLGILGAILALIGCVLGNAFSFVAFIAQQSGTPLVDAFVHTDVSALASLMTKNFAAMDLLFYAIAIYEGYKFSSR